ncbi:hypothetical protein [Acinetobacter gerneri]|nr:hypothetical protein [Acinetobacter gerneri]
MYRAYDIQQGEKMLKLTRELKELALKFDAMNKQTYRENYDHWSMYNVWLDIVVSQVINPTLDHLEKALFFKRNNPQHYVSFGTAFPKTLSYYFSEKTVFNQGQKPTAFPYEQAEDDFYQIMNQIIDLDSLCDLGEYARAGDHLSDFFYFITDGKERERDLDWNGAHMLKEPEIYPTYLVYPKPYHSEQHVEKQGAYISDNPLKTFEFYPEGSKEFRQTKVNKDDIKKLDYPVQQVSGFLEFGLYDINSEYYSNPDAPLELNDEEIWLDTNWYYVKEIPPNTEGIANNPLRLEDLRYPLKQGEKYISLDEIKQKDGYVHGNPNVMVENYGQVAYRYEKYYRDYLLKNAVDPDLLIHYQMK